MLDDDAWVRRETQQFHTLRNSLHHMISMQRVLHDVFIEVVKSDSWSFFAIRQLKEYHEAANWDFLTRNSSHADGILQHHKERIEGHAQGLAKELLGTVAGTLGEAHGESLKQTPNAWKEIESVLVKASDVVQDHKVSNPALHSGIQGSLLHLKSMIDDGTPLPELSNRALKRTLPESSEGRRSRYYLAEHWTGLSNAQLAFMKTVLALDYGTWKEKPEQEKTKLPDLLLDVTPLQQEFVVTEAQADRDLRTAQNTLYHALTL